MDSPFNTIITVCEVAGKQRHRRIPAPCQDYTKSFQIDDQSLSFKVPRFDY